MRKALRSGWGGVGGADLAGAQTRGALGYGGIGSGGGSDVRGSPFANLRDGPWRLSDRQLSGALADRAFLLSVAPSDSRSVGLCFSIPGSPLNPRHPGRLSYLSNT
ncbi:hypothetical protein DPEC_G00079190 [Dallia pectoralis]|uniref:Uncharacterized protein n=1 Tax=Dallia pectoralis TaxID=75939 RepID=A0ACC2H4A1_DALPE|nr:hypothetical protein DPEC_G00079190 [Dallia pectoralis]